MSAFRWECDKHFANGIRWVLKDADGYQVGRVIRHVGDRYAGALKFEVGQSRTQVHFGFPTLRDAAVWLLEQVQK